MEKNKKILVVAVAAVVVVAAVAGIFLMKDEEKLQFGYVTWDGEISSTNVLTLILQEAGYNVEMISVDAGPLYNRLAEGDLDFTTSTWMPITHGTYWEQYGDELEVAGTNLEGVKIGMVVPKYVYDGGVHTISDLNDYSDKFKDRIVGIEPGAGVVEATERAINDYDLKEYELQTSSSAGMLAELKKAYDKKEWIAVTLWSPHWAFEEWDLEYLEDPKTSYGEEEHVETVTRIGFADEHPGAYAILEAFEWTDEDIESVMYDIFVEKMNEEEAAQKWIDANRDRVDEWIDIGKEAEEQATESKAAAQIMARVA